MPARKAPSELGVQQKIYHSPAKVDEFVFCDDKGGPWSCEHVSRKTKTDELPQSDNESLDKKVKDRIKSLSTNVSPAKKVLAGEKRIPESSPLATIEFDFDSAGLRAQAKISLLEVLPKLKGKRVELHGYTDNIGNQPYNNGLGQRRANTVLGFIRSTNVATVELSAFGHGLCCYVAPNDTDEQRGRNRRVEIYVVE